MTIQQRRIGTVIPHIRELHKLAGYRFDASDCIIEESDDTRRNQSNRAALAHLRRSLGKDLNNAPDVFPYVTGYTYIGFTRDERERRENSWNAECFSLVGGLFALNPETTWQRTGEEKRTTSFGTTYKDLVEAMLNKGSMNNPATSDDSDDAKRSRRENLERRFVALLKSRRGDLPSRLGQAVRLMKAQETPIRVDWVKLLYDLMEWKDRFTIEPRHNRNAEPNVQRRWANDFWDFRRPELIEDDEDTNELIDNDDAMTDTDANAA